MAICKPNCVTALPSFGAINDCDVTSLLASGEIAKVIFTKCDTTFTDVDDDTEWAAKVDDGDITVPFVGNGKLDETQESGEIRVGCQTVSTICKKPFEFTSYITDTTNQTDSTLYNDILKQRLGLTVTFLTCDGHLLINPDWTTGAGIGSALSMLKISQIFTGEADSKMHYKISGEITECRSLKRVKLSADTIAVINAA